MNESSLAEAIQRPEIHRTLLGNYDGAYALGITTAPEHKDRVALLLRIEGTVPKEIPTHIAVDGEQIPVVVQGGFKAPKRQ
ncbi:MAG TPA: hypothetical protein VJ901_03000 [Thermoanaerobaculia bacterium]|nr:hypothetical protein [Thermoanaerobaculia bacterium]